MQVGPANFARTPAPREQAEHVSQVFLGVRLECANCHNHPLDRWTQDDYHGLAAIFARLDRGREVQLAAARRSDPSRARAAGRAADAGRRFPRSAIGKGGRSWLPG